MTPLPRNDPASGHPPSRPEPIVLWGEHLLLRPVDPDRDAGPLYRASHPPAADPGLWTYLPDGPYDSPEHLSWMLAWAQAAEDRVYFALLPLASGEPAGIASYCRAEPETRSMEIGHVWFGAGLRRRTPATEAIYLLARHAFEQLGYHRLEWKCHPQNVASRQAAERFGFSFEGAVDGRQVIKGRNVDIACYALTDARWLTVRAGFERWLDPGNFDASGRQRLPLRDCRTQ